MSMLQTCFYDGQASLRSDWFDEQWDHEAKDFLRGLPLLHCHALLFGLQDRIVERLAEYEPNALATFEYAADRARVHRLKDDEDEDRYYLPRRWCVNYQWLADIVLEKERSEIALLIAGRAA